MVHAGVDGCKGGWFVVLVGDHRAGFTLLRTFAEVGDLCRLACRVFVDIPIGLPADHVRLADIEARQALPTRRKSSVFNTPVRAAVYAKDNASAQSVNEQLTGKSLSLQSLGFMRKIREVDEWLQDHPAAAERVLEAHPEVCFGCLGRAYPKHRKKDRAGELERVEILEQYMPDVSAILDSAMDRFARTRLAADDVLDACALAVAARESGDEPRFFPGGMDTPPTDETGLPMAIWHPGLPDQGADT